MYIKSLDLETRNKLYNKTKKVLRKYQKGIMNGKLSAVTFAESILENGTINDIIENENIIKDCFINSYTDYIQELINIQNETLNIKKGETQKPTVSQRLELKNLLNTTEFKLSIPIDYLNYDDINSIIKYIKTNNLDIGEERIYNYVCK
ncbi:MAG: hypothetical protein R3Y64_02110 [Peptostreptococcaceae bacterium]